MRRNQVKFCFLASPLACLFDMPIRPQAIHAEIPKEDDAHRTCLCQIQRYCNMSGKHGQPNVGVCKRKDDGVDCQPDQIHRGEFEKLVMHRVFARFGECPQTIPCKVRNDGARDRNDVGVDGKLSAKDKHEQIQYGKINDRAKPADDKELDKTSHFDGLFFKPIRRERIHLMKKIGHATPCDR